MSTNKKILIGAGILTLIIVIGGFVYVLTHKQTSIATTSSANSPFGSGGTSNARTDADGTSLDVTGVATQIKTVGQLRELSATPVSGAAFIAPTSSSSDAQVAFIERATGYLFDADLTSGSISRLTNDTIPKIENVVWGASGTQAIVQSLDSSSNSGSIDTSFIEATTITSTSSAPTTATTTQTISSTSTELQTFELQPNILAVALSPSADKIFYILHGVGGAQGFVSDFKGDNAVSVWQSGTDEWNAVWGMGSADTTVYLTSKASNGVGGFLYGIDVNAKTNDLLLSNIPGLSTLPSPMGDEIFYTSIANSTTHSYVYDVKTNTSNPLEIATIAEKCAWAPDETFLYCAVPRTLSADMPDDWYQGTVSFDDDIWKVSLDDGSVAKVAALSTTADPTDTTNGIDVVNPMISADGNTMLFMNKKDLSLWSVTVGN